VFDHRICQTRHIEALRQSASRHATRLNLAIEQALVKLAYPASSRLRLHPKRRLPADTPVAQLVGSPRNVAPVPLRPGLRRQQPVRDQRHHQCKIRRKLLLRPRGEREEALQARILPAAGGPLPSVACRNTMPLMSWPGIQPSSLLRNDRNSPRLSENACTATSASCRPDAGSGTCRSSTGALPSGVD